MKRRLILACVLAGAYVVIVSATAVTDSFTRANAENLGANWTNQTNSPDISSNTAIGDAASAPAAAFYSASSFANDQCASGVIGGLSVGNNFPALTVRAKETGASGDYYAILTDGTNTSFRVVVNASATDTTITQTFSNGDTLMICAVGTTITGHKNGAQFYSTTDASLATGSPGMEFYGVGTIDNFAGTDETLPASSSAKNLLLKGVGE